MAKDFPGKTPAVAPVVAVVVVAVTAAAAEVGPTDCVPIPSMLRVSGGAIVVAGPSPVRFRGNFEGRSCAIACDARPEQPSLMASGKAAIGLC